MHEQTRRQRRVRVAAEGTTEGAGRRGAGHQCTRQITPEPPSAVRRSGSVRRARSSERSWSSPSRRRRSSSTYPGCADISPRPPYAARSATSRGIETRTLRLQCDVPTGPDAAECQIRNDLGACRAGLRFSPGRDPRAAKPSARRARARRVPRPPPPVAGDARPAESHAIAGTAPQRARLSCARSSRRARRSHPARERRARSAAAAGSGVLVA